MGSLMQQKVWQMNKFKIKGGYINLDNISYIDLEGDRVYFVGGIDDYIILIQTVTH